MTIELATCAAAELGDAVAPILHYLGRSPVAEQIAALARVMPAQRVHTARDGDRVVGAAGSFAFDLTVPGGRVAAAGVTIVAVLPTHRRRGILRQMMRRQLDACRERGEPVAYLWAAEDTIYDRFGYGIALFSAEVDLPRDRAHLYRPATPPACTRLIAPDAAAAVLSPIYHQVAGVTPGMFVRTPDWWQARTLADPSWRRGNGGELQCVTVERDGQAAAYALYRITPGFERGIRTATVQVVEAIGESPVATRAIWRYLLEIDLVSRITAFPLPVDHPLLLLVAEPRRLRFGLREGVWVRLVEVGAALSARRYAAGEGLVIDLDDEFCPWNGGRWRISGEGVARTREGAHLRCGVSALGSAYLGGVSWTQLVRALRVAELAPGAAERADALFRTPCAPWCPEIF